MIKTKNSDVIIDNLLVIIYSLAIVFFIFSRSMLNYGLKESYIFLTLFFSISIILKKYSLKDYIFLIIGIGMAFASKSLQCFFMIITLFAAKDVKLYKLLQASVISVLCGLAIVYCLAAIGKIPNILISRNSIIRQSLGMSAPLVFSAYIFYVCVCLTLLYIKKHPVWLTIVFFIVIIFLDQVINARNDELCILFLILIVWVRKLRKSLKSRLFVLACLLSIFIIIMSMFITKIFPYGSSSYFFLENMLSGRLGLQSVLFQEYSPHLLGQYIPQIGHGGNVLDHISNYFYIDNSFLRFLFMNGIAFSLFLFFVFTKQIFKLYEKEYFSYALILLLILVNGISSDTLSLISLNVIILPLFGVNISEYTDLF